MKSGKRTAAWRLGAVAAVAAWSAAAGALAQLGGWEVDYEAVSQAGEWLWEQVAPEGAADEWAVMDGEQLRRLAGALEGGALEDLAALAPMAREALAGLRGMPGLEWAADWLGARLDYFEMAAECERVIPAPAGAGKSGGPAAGRPGSAAGRPGTAAPAGTAAGGDSAAVAAVKKARGRYSESVETWTRKLKGRAKPAGAARWEAVAKRAFRAEGVPEVLVWQAEAESSFNPAARSPAGAVGLFQFMKATAKEQGLNLEPVDERLDGEKSAGAAARYLKALHGRFGDWRLALAAYNAGPARVSRLLKAAGGRRYEDVADRLPAETRMYVPKIEALVQIREGAGLWPAD